MEDQELMELFYTRSELAIRQMQNQYGGYFIKIARNILQDHRDAEECVNDALLAVWNTVPPNRPKPLLTYACHIVRNLAIKKYHSNRAQKRNSHYDMALDELEECIRAQDSVEDEYTVKETVEAINRFLEGLERQSRMMFVRRYWFADSLTDIAEQFHISERNVSLRLVRVRKKLKKYLEKEGIWI